MRRTIGFLGLRELESLGRQHSKELAEVFEQLRCLSVRLALDDLGTGWSSLDTLRCFPFDGLKIDQCLVADLPFNPHTVAIVCAIIQLTGDLGISVTAEGMEDTTQLRILRDLGCERLQGFLVAVPEQKAAAPRRNFWHAAMQ